MFYCREKELSALNARYYGDEFEFIVFTGRRRVGKTTLISEFCKDKPTVFFSALQDTAKGNLTALSKAIYSFTDPDDAAYPVYPDFDSALDKISNIAKDNRLIFVIDEYPYLAKADKSFSSRLQHLIDHKWKGTKIFFIICGSSISFMEKKVLSSKSPLFGRRTGQYKLRPLTYKEITGFHPELSFEDQALLYGISGGVPHYINQLRIKGDLDEALINNLFNNSGYLYEEPYNLLKQELREPAIYNSIITAIATGASRLNEISTKVGVESGLCSKYIRQLIEIGIVKKERPIKEASTKKKIYLLNDNFFRFWYKFVPQNTSAIVSGRFPQIFDKAVKPYFSDYMGLTFEGICKEYLEYHATDLPILLSEVGQWWGTDIKERKEIQMDIVGKPISGKDYIIGSCKYTNDLVGMEELEKICRSFRKRLPVSLLFVFKKRIHKRLARLCKRKRCKVVFVE